MKKLILSLMLVGFAVAVQARDGQPGDKEPSCCAKAKTTVQAKGECPMMSKQAKATCPYAGKNAKEASAKPALQSPKALADARR